MCNCLTPSAEHKIFDAATLTASYETSGVTFASEIECRSNDRFTLIVIYTPGAAETSNICEIEVSFSPDNSTYAVYGTWADGGSGQMTYTRNYFNVDQSVPAIINLEGLGRYMRVRAKEEGVAANAGTVTAYLYRSKA